MKKSFVSLCCLGCLACAAIAITSCMSTREVATISTLNGEWNIVEINGSAVVPGTDNEYPYIEFDTTTGRVSGNSGCNRMTGSFSNTGNPGVISLGEIASTRMLCPDMTTEQNVLNALQNVRGYRKMSNNRIALTNSLNRPVIVLASRMGSSTGANISGLEGEWKITEVKGETVPGGLDKQPFLAFDTAQKRIHGNAGCNLMNGGYTTETNNARSISFPGVGVTMMACLDMTLERKILDAMNEVKTFDFLANNSLGLYNGNGNLVLLLKK